MIPQKFFNLTFRKDIKSKIKQKIINLINNQNFNHHIVEFVIKSFHFQQIFVSFICVLFLSKQTFIINFIISSVLALLFFYLDGCVLSSIEYYFCQDKQHFINIIDPFIELFGKDITDDIRYLYTLYFVALYYICCLFRFIYEYY